MNSLTYTIIGITLFVVGIIGWNMYSKSQPSKYDEFAKCLTEKKVTFYGAFWCPHCQNTKKSFGNAAQYLNYVECSTPDSKGQTQVCTDAGIKGYPTWEFPDGSRLEGEIPMATLAEKSTCTLPE
jgi:thiol-disulfide isomerase/thioredoxin